MGVAREIGKHRCGSGEWPLGVDDPFGPSQRSERGGEGAPVSKGYEIAEEGQPPGLMQRREAFEKQPPEQARQRQTGRKKRGLQAIQREPSDDRPPPGTIMCRCGWGVRAEP